MKVALYARVSTRDKDQNPEVQLYLMRQYCQTNNFEIFGEYVDEASATDYIKRDGWAKLMKHAATRRFQMIIVWRMDRAWRSLIDAVTTMQDLKNKGIDFRAVSQGAIDTSTPMGNYMFQVLMAAAEFERETIRVRVVESVDHYKRVGTKSGKPWGRPRRSVDFNKVLEALRNNNWRCNRAAAWLSEQTGETYVPGSVWNRVNEVAAESGMTVRQYIAAAKAESCQGGGK
ncbi:MAG: recombinase family protein [Dehalogenimonas sp.]